MISAVGLIFAECFACRIQQTETFMRTCLTCGADLCVRSLYVLCFFLGRAILSCTCVVLHESSCSLLLFSRGMRELCAFVGCSA